MKSQQNYINVIHFINEFKKINIQVIEELFTCGYCYWFAEILKNRFNGVIYYLPIENHFIVLIGEKFFDITGELNISNDSLYIWDEYKNIDILDYERIVKYCILKEN